MSVKAGLTDIAGGYVGSTSVKKMYVGGDQVRPASPYPTESIVLEMRADDDGNLYVPVSVSYSRLISIDDGPEYLYSGQGDSGLFITVGTGYTPGSTHIIVIKPTVVQYGWAVAFCFYNTGKGHLLKRIIQDKSYIGFAESANRTGGGFRGYQYYGCTAIQSAPAEILPSTVEDIGQDFRRSQYYGCSSLINAPEEVMPNSVLTLSNGFRESQYEECTSLINAPKEIYSNSITLTLGYIFRSYQYRGCKRLLTAEITPPPNVVGDLRFYRSGQFAIIDPPTKIIVTISGNTVEPKGPAGLSIYGCSQIRVPSALLSAYQNEDSWSSVSSLFVGY